MSSCKVCFSSHRSLLNRWFDEGLPPAVSSKGFNDDYRKKCYYFGQAIVLWPPVAGLILWYTTSNVKDTALLPSRIILPLVNSWSSSPSLGKATVWCLDSVTLITLPNTFWPFRWLMATGEKCKPREKKLDKCWQYEIFWCSDFDHYCTVMIKITTRVTLYMQISSDTKTKAHFIFFISMRIFNRTFFSVK